MTPCFNLAFKDSDVKSSMCVYRHILYSSEETIFPASADHLYLTSSLPVLQFKADSPVGTWFFFKNGKAYAVVEKDGFKFVKRYGFEIQDY